MCVDSGFQEISSCQAQKTRLYFITNSTIGQNSMQEHKFLSLHRYHLSNNKAESAVDDLLKRIGFSLLEITSMKRGTRLLWESGNTHIWLRYKKLVTEMREGGTVEQLDSHLDSLDPIFGGQFALATTSSAITLSISYTGYSQTLQGSARLYQAEYELGVAILNQ